LDPTDTGALFWSGWYQAEAGHLAEAESAYRRAIAASAAEPGSFAVRAQLGIGDIDLARGSLPSAAADYRAAVDVVNRLLKSDPGNAAWLSDLSASYDKIGDVQKAQGDLAGALASYRNSLAIGDRLAKSDPGNAGWQRDVAVSNSKNGDVQTTEGDLAGALASYRNQLAIADWLAKSNPGNVDWQRDLSVSYDMKAMTNFQDNWNVSYMKDHQADVDPAYAKAFQDFQSNWNVSYMKAAKDFQDNFSTSYMK
jgi:tetratricopeptide (TPR) repeat protein